MGGLEGQEGAGGGRRGLEAHQLLENKRSVWCEESEGRFSDCKSKTINRNNLSAEDTDGVMG